MPYTDVRIVFHQESPGTIDRMRNSDTSIGKDFEILLIRSRTTHMTISMQK